MDRLSSGGGCLFGINCSNSMKCLLIRPMSFCFPGSCNTSNLFLHICINLLYTNLSDNLPVMYGVIWSRCRKGQPVEGEGRCQG